MIAVVNLGGGLSLQFEAKNVEAAIKAAAAVALKPCPCGAGREILVPFWGKTKDGREYGGFKCACGRRTYVNRSKTGHVFWSQFEEPPKTNQNQRPRTAQVSDKTGRAGDAMPVAPPEEQFDDDGVPF